MACSLPVKSRKRLAQDILDTFATHAHATDRLLDAKYQHSWSCLQLSNVDLLTNRIQNWAKSMCVYYCCPIPTDKACVTSSAWFPFKLGSYLLMMWSLETVLTAGEIEGERRRKKRRRKKGGCFDKQALAAYYILFFPHVNQSYLDHTGCCLIDLMLRLQTSLKSKRCMQTENVFGCWLSHALKYNCWMNRYRHRIVLVRCRCNLSTLS